MKQLSVFFVLALIALSGCQKMESNDLVDPQALRVNGGDKCQLQSIIWNDGFNMSYTYNSKGLVETWTEDFYGDIWVNRYTYDAQNRVISTRYSDINDAIIYTYHYTGNRVTRIVGTIESTGALWNDMSYTYDRNGEIIAQDDVVQDIHSTTSYDNQGNAVKIDIYFGSDLAYTAEYAYDKPNRNAFLALNGLDFWATQYGAALFDKRWESSVKVYFYDATGPFLVTDYDPASITMETGPRNYITYTSFFDRAADSQGDITFTYANCGGNNQATSPKAGVKKGRENMKARISKMLRMSNKNLKKEFVELKNELRPSGRN